MKKADLVRWLKTTPWLRSKLATIQVPPPIIRQLVRHNEELERRNAELRRTVRKLRKEKKAKKRRAP